MTKKKPTLSAAARAYFASVANDGKSQQTIRRAASIAGKASAEARKKKKLEKSSGKTAK